MAGTVVEYISAPIFSQHDNVCVNPVSLLCLGSEFQAMQSTAAASAAVTQNLIIYVPITTVEPVVVSQFYWHNGATVNGNTDAGIYVQDGTSKVVSTGSTLNSGASQIQVVNVADVTLGANARYWLAIGSDSATHTYRRWALVTTALDLLGVKQQASGWSSGLPTSATFGTPSVAYLPVFGFTAKAI